MDMVPVIDDTEPVLEALGEAIDDADAADGERVLVSPLPPDPSPKP